MNYGDAEPVKAGMGDPISVDKNSRPVADDIHKWALELANDPTKRELAERMIGQLSDDDLHTWQWPRDRLWAHLEQAGEGNPPQTPLNSYTFQRRVMLALKKDIHQRPHGKMIKRIKYYCDVLLRE